MKKFLTLIAVMLLGAASMMAQNPDKGYSWAVEGGVGTEVELGGRVQYNFNKYVAWDILNAKYALDYDKYYNTNEITLTTGVRGYSPTFGADMKAFASIDLGYGAKFRDGNNWNAFALDFNAGVYVWKGLYAGYGFSTMAHDGHHCDHLFRIGYNVSF